MKEHQVHSHRKTLLKYVSAFTSFSQVEHSCTEIGSCYLKIERLNNHTKSKETDESITLYEKNITAFSTAAIIAYTRPFTDNDGIGQLSKKKHINPEDAEFHDMLRKMRNTLVAHSDRKKADQIFSSSGIPVNSCRLECENGDVRFVLRSERLSLQSALRLAAMAKFLKDKMQEGIDSEAKKVFHESNLENGFYELHLGLGESWLKKLKN